MSQVPYSAKFWLNDRQNSLPDDQGQAADVLIKRILSDCPAKRDDLGEESTPLVRIPEQVCRELGVGSVFVKDESKRVGLNAFKVCGASYAIQKRVDNGEINPATDCLSTMTDGNHGRAVAWAAKRLNMKAVIYVPENTVQARIDNIRGEGATVEVVKGTYDAAVEYAEKQAKDNGWHFIADQSLPGYTEVPSDIMTGYLTLFNEAARQAEELGIKFTHVMLQAGVGSFAGAGVSWASNNDVKVAIVEADDAECIMSSVKNGSLTETEGKTDSIMAGLNCGVPSFISLPILQKHSDQFIAIDDAWAEQGCRFMGKYGIVSGESGAAGMAGLLAGITMKGLDWMGLDKNSQILVINTEGDTDPVMYEKIMKTEFCMPVIK